MYKLIKEIEKEIIVLEKWVNEIETGGWSTIHLSEMKSRIKTLINLLNEL